MSVSSRTNVRFKGEKGIYKLGTLLATSTRNSVYLCESNGQQEYVIKFCASKERFKNEMMVLTKSLSRVPELIDIGRGVCPNKDFCGEVDFIVMEKCGLNLAQCLKMGHFSLRSALQACIEVIECLKQIASKNIEHRDLKLVQFCIATNNSENRCLKLIDFDSAEQFDYNELLEIGEQNDEGNLIWPYLDLLNVNYIFGELVGKREDFNEIKESIGGFEEGIEHKKPASRKEILKKYDQFKALIKTHMKKLPKESSFPVIVKDGQEYELASIEPKFCGSNEG